MPVYSQELSSSKLIGIICGPAAAPGLKRATGIKNAARRLENIYKKSGDSGVLSPD